MIAHWRFVFGFTTRAIRNVLPAAFGSAFSFPLALGAFGFLASAFFDVVRPDHLGKCIEG